MYCRSPEFFYPKRFITIKSTATHLNISTVSTICHGTHLEEVKEICTTPNSATFVGREKRWRPGTEYNEYEQTYSLDYCSYTVEDIRNPMPMTKDRQWPFGPFLWFGTSKSEADNYGPYCFEFNFKSVLKKYLQTRGSDQTLCYRAGGTLVYKQEVTHVVIICCEDDKDYQSYPLIDATSTKYFKPPIKFIRSNTERTEPLHYKKRKIEKHHYGKQKIFMPQTVPGSTEHRKRKRKLIRRDSVESSPLKKRKINFDVQAFEFGRSETGNNEYHSNKNVRQQCSMKDASIFNITQDGTLSYHSLPLEELTIPALINSGWRGGRHEHVVLAFYLPHGIALQLTNLDGTLLEASHYNRCIKSKGKQCQFAGFERCYIDDFNEYSVIHS